MGVTRFEELRAWQEARILVKQVYALVGESALSRDFGLRDQFCRAAVSVMSNVAEGFARKTSKEFGRFLDIARGSAAEVQSLSYVALDLGHVDHSAFDALHSQADRCISLIAGLARSLRSAEAPTPHAARRTPNATEE